MLCELMSQLSKEAAARQLQPLVVAGGRQAALPGVLCACREVLPLPSDVGGVHGKTKSRRGNHKGGIFLLLAVSPDDSRTSGVHPHCFLLLSTSCSARLGWETLSQKLLVRI